MTIPYELDTPPATLNEQSRINWLSDEAPAPALGQIWLLTHEEEAKQMVVIAAIYDTYFLGIPVTIGIDSATNVQLILPADYLGTEATIWAFDETGMDSFLLHRYIHEGLDADKLLQLRLFGRGNTEPPFTRGTVPQDAAFEERERIVDEMMYLCYLEPK